MANLRDFLKATMINKGASYNVVTGELNPKSGYMVAIAGHERVIDNVTSEKQLQYLIADYLGDKAIILTSGITGDDKFVGTWVNDGKLYLDVSVNIADKDTAIALAKSSNQLAIWDCKNQTEIKTA